MSEPLREVVDPALLSQLSGLSLRARQLIEGGLAGQHRSPHRGASVEFSQHREYSPGDDLRRLDWKAFAKSDRYQIKQYEDETNLRAFLLVDTSGSMDYAGKGRPTKLDYAARLAAAFAWLLLRQGDAVGLLPFGEETSGLYVPPRARPDHFWELVEVLQTVPVGGRTRAAAALRQVAEVAAGRSLVLLFSDCFEFDDELAAVARQLRRKRHRVVVFHLLDPDELRFPFEELTLFDDMESEARVLADPRGMKQQYLKEIANFCATLRDSLLEGDVDYMRLLTDEPLERAILSFAGSGAP